MKRLLILAGAITITAASSAQAYQFSPLPLRHQQRDQRALSFQLNRQVARHWRIDPVSFAPGGIPIIILPDVSGPCRALAQGCHTLDGTPRIYVTAADEVTMTETISHEMIETEVDHLPLAPIAGVLPEPCDPVPQTYSLFGVNVVDFVFPRWFYGLQAGPWDQLKTLRGPMTASDRSDLIAWG